MTVRLDSPGLIVDGLTGDYEYGVSVDAEHVDSVRTALMRLLEEASVEARKGLSVPRLLKVAFDYDLFDSETDYQEWLRRMKIPHEFFSWISP